MSQDENAAVSCGCMFLFVVLHVLVICPAIIIPTLVFGILFVAVVLPLDYAKVGIYALSFGDGLASLVGKICGKHKIPKAGGKTFEGSIACFIAVFISTLCVTKRVGISLLVALLAMLIEVLPLADFDNLMIPIAIGSFYMFLSQIF